MKKILFVCSNNSYCLSLATFTLKHMIHKKDLNTLFEVNDMTLSNETHIINKDTKKELIKNNIPYQVHNLKQLQKEDYNKYDYIIGMNNQDINEILSIIKKDNNRKVFKLLDFTNNPNDILEPTCYKYYSKTYNKIKYGLDHFLTHLLNKNLEENKQLLYQLFDNITDIITIKKGYHLRDKFKVITKNKKYFVKIHNGYLNEQDINNHKILYEYYRKCNIPIIPFIDIKNIQNKTFFIYEYQNHKSLLEENLTPKEYYDYGYQIGKDVLKLQQISYDKHKNIFKKIDIQPFYENDVARFKDNENKYEILKLFTKKEKKELIKIFTSLFNDIKKEPHCLNHNDIKPENILIKNNNYYIIDIDFFGLTLTGFNVYYSMTSFLMPNFEDNIKWFLRGFIQSIDPDKKLLKQLHYFLIADFSNELILLSNKCYNEINQNINHIKAMLFNINNIISEEIYKSI